MTVQEPSMFGWQQLAEVQVLKQQSPPSQSQPGLALSVLEPPNWPRLQTPSPTKRKFEKEPQENVLPDAQRIVPCHMSSK
mmetsp:Transcript_1795/g.7854  ORF Transcript_1795/g.7854 Transcript_1795/m.7854 type:complete len:80 (+) Transcript_1795:11983-12222(+)